MPVYENLCLKDILLASKIDDCGLHTHSHWQRSVLKVFYAWSVTLASPAPCVTSFCVLCDGHALARVIHLSISCVLGSVNMYVPIAASSVYDQSRAWNCLSLSLNLSDIAERTF